MPTRPLARALLAAALAFAAAAPGAFAAAAGVVPPAPTRYVTDGSGVLSRDGASALERKLADFERQTSTQVLVWIAPRVPEGTTAEDLGADAIRAWGVGQKGKDNGAVLFLFTEDRLVRIATGYGLEGAIPDVRAQRILREVVKPSLARGDVRGGVDAGVEEILRAARGEPFQGTGRTVKEGRRSTPALLGAAVAALVLLVVLGFRRPLVAGVVALAGGVAGLAWVMTTFKPGDVLAAPFYFMGTASLFLLTVALMRWLGRRDGYWHAPSGSVSSGSSSGGSDSSWSSDRSSSSSDSGGFSGGGGDRGGGGAGERY
jgi:uncharacterized protein